MHFCSVGLNYFCLTCLFGGFFVSVIIQKQFFYALGIMLSAINFALFFHVTKFQKLSNNVLYLSIPLVSLLCLFVWTFLFSLVSQ